MRKAVLILVLFLLAGCGSTGQASTPTPNLPLTRTSTPTATPTPGPSPTPTATQVFVKPPWGTIQTFQGNGSKSTDTFVVPSHWRIFWSCDLAVGDPGYHISAFLHKPNGDLVDEAFSTKCQDGNTSGPAEIYRGGTFYLEVSSIGDWSLQVQVPN